MIATDRKGNYNFVQPALERYKILHSSGVSFIGVPGKVSVAISFKKYLIVFIIIIPKSCSTKFSPTNYQNLSHDKSMKYTVQAMCLL